MIQIGLGLLLAGVSAAYDYEKRFVNHKLRWGFRFVAATFLAFIGGFTIWQYFTNLFIIASVFYAIFDYMLNIFEGRYWGYIGDTAIWDKIRKKLYGRYLVEIDFVSKILLIVIALIIKYAQ